MSTPVYTLAEMVQMTVVNAKAYGLDPVAGVAQIQQESQYDQFAVGPPTKYGTAKGLAQFIDSTAKAYGIGNPFDPADELPGWARYMSDLLAEFGSIDLALAAYNAGPGNVRKYGGIPPFTQTKNYVWIILSDKAQADAKAMIDKYAPDSLQSPSILGAVALILFGGFIYWMVR